MVNASLGFGLTNVPHHMLDYLKRDDETMGIADTRQEISSVQQVLTAGLNISAVKNNAKNEWFKALDNAH